jgi:hypothetical protein
MTYNGGKGRLYQHHINLIPPHQTWFSGFLGGGSVTKMKLPAKRNIVVDMDETAVSSFQSHVMADPKRYGERGWNIVLGSMFDVLPTIQLTEKDFGYFDPPYPFHVRAGGERPLYRHEFGTIEEHQRLLDVLLGLDCMVMVCGYECELYYDVLNDWNMEKFKTYTRSGREVYDHVWYNYDPPLALHDYRYLGDDFRERERIKRKSTRWVNRFESLPILERKAIVSRLIEAGVI